MAASVWMMLVRVSVVPALLSPAWTVRPVAETMPEVTVGVPADRPEGVADGDDGVTHLELAGVPEGDGLEVRGRRIDLEEGHVITRVGPHQGGRAGPWSGRRG